MWEVGVEVEEGGGDDGVACLGIADDPFTVAWAALAYRQSHRHPRGRLTT